VHLGCETSTHYFPFSGGTGTDSTKNVPGHVTLNLYFCFRWYLRVTYCILMRPSRETWTHYFSCSGGTGMDYTKTATWQLRRTCVFASGRICMSCSASGASRAPNIDALFSCLGRTGSDSTKSELGNIIPNLCFCIQ
jgi:hypothetical protein